MEHLEATLHEENARRIANQAWDSFDSVVAILNDFRAMVAAKALPLSEGLDPHYIYNPYRQPPSPAGCPPAGGCPPVGGCPTSCVPANVPDGRSYSAQGSVPPAGGFSASWERQSEFVLNVIRQSTRLTVVWKGPKNPIELHRNPSPVAAAPHSVKQSAPPEKAAPQEKAAQTTVHHGASADGVALPTAKAAPKTVDRACGRPDNVNILLAAE